MNSTHDSYFDTLNDDTLLQVLHFIGEKSYFGFGAINSRCNNIFRTSNFAKETFLYGYAPLHVITRKRRGKKLHWFLTKSNSIATGIVQFNRRDVLSWSMNIAKHKKLILDICREASKIGSLEILDEVFNSQSAQLIPNCVKKSGELCQLAARGNHWDVLIYLRGNGYSLNVDTCEAAAMGGNLQILKWLKDNGCHWNQRVFAAAAEGGNLTILNYLKENGCQWDSRASIAAAKKGHLECLKYLKSQGCEIDSFAFSVAAEAGKLEICQWLYENGYYCKDKGKWASSLAAGNGHISVLKFLSKIECDFGVWTCRAAAFNGQKETLIWLRNKGYKWNQYDKYI